MKVVILAGGLGTRLRKSVDDRPKVLSDINGVPFLQIIINQFVLILIIRLMII